MSEEPQKHPQKVIIPYVLGVWRLNILDEVYIWKWSPEAIGYEGMMFFLILMAAVDPWGERRNSN